VLAEGPAVIFVTAHDRHALEAFELNALDYLVKLVRAARLAAALGKARRSSAPSAAQLERAAPGARSHLPVSERNRIVLVPTAEVVYLKAELKYVTLRTREREFVIEESLVALEKEYAERLVRIHRNCLVARAAIRAFERVGASDGEPHWKVVLDGVAERLPVSRRQWSAVRAIAAEKGAAQ
jgi:two-component system response regulator AlgR